MQIAISLAFFVLVSAAGAVENDSQAPRIEGLRVGLDNLYKVGHWTAVRFVVQAGEDPVKGFLELTLPDGDGVPSLVRSPSPVRIEPRDRAVVTLYAKPGRIDAPFEAALWPSGDAPNEPIARSVFTPSTTADERHQRPALPATRELIVRVGTSIGLEQTARLVNRVEHRSDSSRIDVARLEGVSQLPAHRLGYDGVDVVVISAGRVEDFVSLSVDDPRIAALDRWVRLGGKLVLLSGEAAPQLLRENAPLARFAPGPVLRMVPLRTVSNLESYSRSTVPIPLAPGFNRALNVPLIDVGHARIDVGDGELALVCRRPLGFGTIVFVALDLDREPLSNWRGRERFVAELLDYDVGRAEARDEPPLRSAVIAEVGFNDLSGQLRAALDQFSEVRVVPFWLVAVFGLAYIAVIGPADYYLVRFLIARGIVRRTQFAWLTFFAIVILTSGAAYLLAVRLKGDRLQVNQVHLVDVDRSSGLVRGASWANLFSPSSSRYDLAVNQGAGMSVSSPNIERGAVMSWMGLPGYGLGGMRSGVADPAARMPTYRYGAALNSLEGVPIEVWSTKAFQSQWWRASWADQVPIEATFTELPDGLLEGSLHNGLEVPLSNCLLAHQRWAYRFDTIEAGETLQIDVLTDRVRTLRAELTGREFADDERARPYNAFSLDIPMITQQLMFNDATGGTEYTGLMHRNQAELDLSGQLELGRAIFAASVSGSHLPDMTLDEKPTDDYQGRRFTFVRIVIPVEPRDARPGS